MKIINKEGAETGLLITITGSIFLLALYIYFVFIDIAHKMILSETVGQIIGLLILFILGIIGFIALLIGCIIFCMIGSEI